ncbi:MAG: TetR/AcrR family transcriptional regulator [Nitrospira sp.]|nr:TetR/AcrR family transcriptional regulator [Nitrospira sp.]MDE0405451.1 TetR/AcrR family transcriptional regulator [Nitrospira sp.]MDE0485681.1 TetR/AcrR family transcriptional regulator [Nitrospira sp.]
MPRKKEFDVDEVLDKAMRAFWKRGYEATSLNDLLDHMQIQRASLYNAFSDKRTLFLDTLRRYDRVHRRAEVAKRLKMPSPRQAILGLFQDAIKAVEKHRARNGCFLVNTAMELSPHDKEVAKFVRRAFTHMERQFFRKRIEQGLAIGEIAKSVAPAQTASAILSLYMGLLVLSRSRPEKLLLESIAKQVELLLPHGDKPALDIAPSAS